MGSGRAKVHSGGGPGAGLLLVAALLLLSCSSGAAPPGGYYVRTERASEFDRGGDVEYKGMRVGEVLGGMLLDGQPVVRFRMGRRYAELPKADARWGATSSGDLVLEDAGSGPPVAPGHIFGLEGGIRRTGGGSTILWWIVTAIVAIVVLRFAIRLVIRAVL